MISQIHAIVADFTDFLDGIGLGAFTAIQSQGSKVINCAKSDATVGTAVLH